VRDRPGFASGLFLWSLAILLISIIGLSIEAHRLPSSIWIGTVNPKLIRSTCENRTDFYKLLGDVEAVFGASFLVAQNVDVSDASMNRQYGTLTVVPVLGYPTSHTGGQGLVRHQQRRDLLIVIDHAPRLEGRLKIDAIFLADTNMHGWRFAAILPIQFCARTRSIGPKYFGATGNDPRSTSGDFCIGAFFSGPGRRFIGIGLNARGVRIADQDNKGEDLDSEPQPFAKTLVQGLGILMIAIGWIIYRRSIRWRWPWWPLIGLLVWLPGLLIFYWALS
jgi:hypothetical protein